MFAKSIVILAALAGSVSAAPVQRADAVPANYASGYLEPYAAYHARYLAINCPSHRNGTSKDQFFLDCCSPLLASEKLDTARPAYCIPTTAAISSANATATATDSAAQSDYSQEATSVANVVASITSTAGSSLTAVTWIQESTTATLEVVTTTPTPTPTPTSTQAPVQTYEAPAATTAAAAASGGDKQGQATYFYQGGVAGACGSVHGDSTPLVALPAQYWNWNSGSSPSQYCGQYIKVTRGDRSVNALVADLCPSCVGADSIDLSVGAFTQIASESEGSVAVSWSFI